MIYKGNLFEVDVEDVEPFSDDSPGFLVFSHAKEDDFVLLEAYPDTSKGGVLFKVKIRKTDFKDGIKHLGPMR